MVVNVERLLKMMIFQNLSQNGEMLKNFDENKKKIFFAVIFFYTMDIKNTIVKPKFYRHFFAISSYIDNYYLQIFQNRDNFFSACDVKCHIIGRNYESNVSPSKFVYFMFFP